MCKTEPEPPKPFNRTQMTGIAGQPHGILDMWPFRCAASRHTPPCNLPLGSRYRWLIVPDWWRCLVLPNQDAVAECAGHSDQPWCFVNKTCPGSRPRTESPELHWKYCDVGEKVTLPLLLPSIAQEIADALAKKPLTVAKRNELAIERARTFKHEDDIDVMVRALWRRF